jgi:starch synthase
MVSELTRSLAELGLDVHVISPYYNYNKKGETGYLGKEGIEYSQNITTTAGNEFVECGLHTGEEMGVKLYFIHHWKYFSTPYQSGSPSEQLQALVVMAKASLELLCQLGVIPSIVITNDWFTGLVPAYARQTGSFGSSFAGTTFFHLVHNLEEGYEGKIYVDGNDDLGHIHQMRREHIVESFDGRVTVLNSSKCALMACSQWGTVSRSYRDDLLRVSPLQALLRSFSRPFAHLNGIRTAERLQVLEAKGASDHDEAKRRVQETYFGGNVDSTIALFAFVGRVVLQKGVHLILECARRILSRPNARVQIMVAGPANRKDPYANSCAWKMAALCSEFPNSFWADPDVFFTDGALVNAGADFALVPSLFEPSGIVQQEFFSGGTPVLAFKTGGLKDTVFEYDPVAKTGNGLTFEAHTFDDLMAAMNRSLRVFGQAVNYAQLRINARASVLDNTVVADAWAREFCRLKERLWNSEHVLLN